MQGANRTYYWLVPATFLAAVGAFFQLSYPLLNDNDVPWHMAIGQLLLKTHSLLATDPWAYHNQDQPWFILSWLWDLVLGIVQSIFGVYGAFVFTITVGAGLTAATCHRLLKLDIALPAVIITTLMTGLCLIDYITARPQLAGYILAFAFNVLMHQGRSDNNYKHMRWLPLLMLVWTNAHGSFMVGFIIMGAYAVEAWFTGKHDWLKRIIIIGACCAVAVLINPYGPKVVLGALLSFKGTATKYTAEWMPFSFGVSTGLSVWLVMVVLASNLRGAGVPIADKVLTVGWFIATMMAIRNGAFFILTSAPYLATCLDEQTRGLRKPQPESPLVKYMNRQPLSRVWVATLAAFAVLSYMTYLMPHADKIETEDFSVKDAIDYALAHDADHHFYTDYSFGGQVIYHAQGKLSFFMDSRAVTAYSDKDMEDYLDFMRVADGWQEIVARHGCNGLLVSKNSAFVSAYDRGLYHDKWKLVFEGTRANVYIARP